MFSKKMIDKHTKFLLDLKNTLSDLGFYTEFTPVGDITPVPILTTAVAINENVEPSLVNMAFSPIDDEGIEKNEFLQISIELNVEVTDKNKNDLIELSNTINQGIIMGHFSINQDVLVHRYTYPMEKVKEPDFMRFLEVFSFISIIVLEYETKFFDLSTGKISIDQAKEICFNL